MSKKKQGRPEINVIPINCELFDAAMKYRNTNMTQLSNSLSMPVNEKTIRRIRKNGKTNLTLLRLIAEYLNVDPYWLTGQMLEIFPELKIDKHYMNPANHPYDETVELKKFIDRDKHFQELLLLHGISKDRFELLSESQRNGFRMEIDLAIQIVIFNYFSPISRKDDLFLSNQELYHLSYEVLNSEAYKRLFRLLMA